MNILHVVPGFFPAVQYGGPATLVFEVAKRQAKSGHNVTVFTTNIYLENKIKANQPQRLEGITVYYFDYSRFWKKRGAHFIVAPKMKVIAEKMFQAKLFDLVHLHELRNYFSPIISKLCRKHSIPYIVTPHGTLFSRGVSVLKKHMFDMLYGKEVLANAAAITALAEKEKGELQQLFSLPAEKIEVVPNGVNLQEFSKLPSKAMLRKKFGIAPNKNIVLFLSRINKMKGLDLLVEAFSAMDTADAVLVVAGLPEGSEKGYFRETKKLIEELGLSERVVFTGLLSGKEKLAAFSSADVFVLPSRYEPFGLVLLEAMAARCPVVATKNSGLAEQLIDSNSAVVVEAEKQKLANAIEKVLGGEILRQRLVKSGSKFAEKFSWENTVKELEGVYARANAAKNA